MRKAVDVSSYQGKIDWQAVKAAGVEAAILKVIRKDLNPDRQFEANWDGCMAADVPISGVYNYSYSTTVSKARSDAQRVLDVLAGRRVKVWMDVEDACQKGLGQRLIDIINAYQPVILQAGLEFGVYTGLSFYNDYIRPYASQLNCDLWIARYPLSRTMKIEENPPQNYRPDIGRRIEGWQYSSKGRISGISGNVDLNEWYGDEIGAETPESGAENDDTDAGGEVTASEINEPVRSLQEALNFDGYTDARGRRLVEDGIIGANTRAALRKVALKAGAWTGSWYSVGSTGGVVMWLQMQLNTVSGTNLTADGKYGHDTRLAVGAWQESHGLAKDYIAGINTILSMVE